MYKNKNKTVTHTKHLGSNHSVSAAPCMDEHVGKGHIANHLAEKYDELYNSIPSTSVNIVNILTHAYQPKTVLLAIMTSIPEDNRGYIRDIKNYRGIITYSSIIL